MDFEKYRLKLVAKEAELLTEIKRAGVSGRERPETGAVDVADESVISERKEGLFRQADRDTQLLNDVQDALRRIADGTYGRCLDGGEKIDEARLDAVPWTKYCVMHQRIHDQSPASRPATL